MYMLNEENYAQQMQEIVEPYVRAHREEKRIEVEEGCRLYVRVYTAEEPVGVVVISHGFTESAKKFTEPVYYYLQNGYCVVIPEHCGHGFSYRLVDDPYLVHVDTWKRYTRDLGMVAELAKEWFPGLPMYLYGHSMGGGIGAALLIEKPELFSRAVLTSPMICPALGAPKAVMRGVAGGLKLLGKTKSYCPGHGPFDPKDPFETACCSSRARYQWYMKIRAIKKEYQTSAASCGWAQESLRMADFILANADEIHIPVKLFSAELETLVSVDAQREFCEKSGAEMIVVPHVKHEIYHADDATVAEYWKEIFAFFKG